MNPPIPVPGEQLKQPDQNGDDENQHSPAAIIGWSVLMFVIGIAAYYYFDHLEQQGGSVRIQWVVALIYEYMGKNGMLYVFCGMGAVGFIVGLVGLALGKEKM